MELKYYLITMLMITGFFLFGCVQNKQTEIICPDGTKVTDESLCKTANASDVDLEPLKTSFKPGEITLLCDKAIEKVNQTLNEIASRPVGQRNKTLIDYEEALTQFNIETASLYFAGYVHPDPVIAAEGSACEEKIWIFNTEITTRKDIYYALKDFVPTNENESRLYDVTIEYLEWNGLNLPDEKLDLVRKMKQELASLELKFSNNLNQDNKTIEFTLEELDGAPQDFLNRLEKNINGKFIITMKYPDYYAVMENVKSSETRKRMNLAFNNLGSPKENKRLLEEAIDLRRKIAQELGFQSWADYKTSIRMAKNASTIEKFITELKPALMESSRKDLEKYLEFKKTFDPNATSVDVWDVKYIETQLKKEKYSLNNDEIREYFPLESVLNGMFSIYSEVFNVSFQEVKEAKVWAPDVKLYRAMDSVSNETIAYIYFDLFPREGKYNHEAMFPLVVGRDVNGTHTIPITAIVANKNPPTENKPALLTHSEVVNLFHELGHTLHNSLSTAPYSSLAGTNVAWDFVETPSQTIEKWAWDPKVIDAVSGHYLNSSQKIPSEIRDKIIMTRKLGLGYTYAQRLAQTEFDLIIHTTENTSLNTTELYNKEFKELVGIPLVEGNNYPSSFGHLMAGYDAAYYSYIWSEVYAFDCYSEFEKYGVTNQTTGIRFRNTILAQGNMKDGMELLREFLNREPNMDAFLKYLNISK